MSTKQNVCLFVSYLGHYYRGSQAQQIPIKSVTGTVKSVLNRCLQIDDSLQLKLSLASRTDVGVHAMMNVFTFQFPSHCSKMSLTELHEEMNETLSEEMESVRVTDIRRASDSFNIRKPLHKTYVYRLGLLPHDMGDVNMAAADMNMMTYKTVGYFKKPEEGFNMEKFRLAAEMFSGVNDLSVFRKLPKELELRSFQRVVRSCSVTIERGLPPPLSRFTKSHFDHAEFWDVAVTGVGFMHKQIRHIVGAMASVGTGALPLERLEERLAHPEWEFPLNEYKVAEPFGLYLVDITYPEGSFLPGDFVDG